ncbi:hypothetical protein C2857_004765 [Epichloe festucae Fl1]|uniref:Uncharacterized protein n=1 Tax=Epichloe festucae (strain Fl1) TaxID=877507 RepID=A0A7S9KL53_EPIFF|nr:hypothetical protein C2857_004765 [Epichloe festucae Fl1]
MASIQTRSATSAGTKVDAGKNAPVIQEGAGPVVNDSLAAESYRADGKFAENRDAEPENSSYSLLGDVSSRGAGGNVQGTQGDAAPTYINSQYTSDTRGPHGKNLKEGGFDHQHVLDGQRRAFEAEVGSINDPSRLAEAKFERKEAATPRVAFNKDSNNGQLSTNTAYDGLERNASA